MRDIVSPPSLVEHLKYNDRERHGRSEFSLEGQYIPILLTKVSPSIDDTKHS